MKDKDLGMKNKLTHKLGTVKALMNQGKGPKDVVNPESNLKKLMNNGGDSYNCDYKEPGKRGVRKLMGQ
jgi:hypothetical protein